MKEQGGILIMMRHGQSEWNKKNLFTGWVDVPLSPEGIAEALKGGEKIKEIPFDIIYTSTLVRAQMTAMLAMSVHSRGKVPIFIHEMDQKVHPLETIYDEKSKKETIPVMIAWQLNERMYGKLQGMDKDEARKQYGVEQVKIWRRSYRTSPPEGESLEMTAKRSIPYFQKKIVPHLQKGNNVFVSAHGNSLRSIVMELDGLSEEEVLNLEIPTGEPLCYAYHQNKWIKKQL